MIFIPTDVVSPTLHFFLMTTVSVIIFVFYYLSIRQARRAKHEEHLRWLIPFAAGFGMFALMNIVLHFAEWFIITFYLNQQHPSLSWEPLFSLTRLLYLLAWIAIAYGAVMQWRGLQASDARENSGQTPPQANSTPREDTWPPAPTVSCKP